MTFAVFSSSAGSGKTYSLVKEYLKIVLQEPAAFRTILAITFTNKAANEMKQRILERLTDISRPSGQNASAEKQKDVRDFIEQVCEETKMPADLIPLRASEVLSLILHNYSDFAVSTIDSFVYRILRTFAYDMQLPVDFDVELDTDRLIAKAVDLLISKAGTDDQVTRLLTGFTEYKASEEYQWQIEGDLRGFAVNLLDEESYDKLHHLRDLSLEGFYQIRTRLGKSFRGFEQKLGDIAEAMMRLIHEKQIPSTAFYHGDRGFFKFIERIAGGDFTKLTPGSFVIQTVEKGKWFSSSTSPQQRSAIQSIQYDLLRHYNQLMQIIHEHQQDYNLFLLLYQYIYPLALLNEIDSIIREIRQQTGAIHISEFNKRIAAIIFNEPVPFIYERLGEKYKHYLIDEFQDTSILQWHNLIPLIDNSLASNHFNMVVGDGKQSIYRWRNGEVEQFVRLPDIYKRRDIPLEVERERNLRRHFNLHVLNMNYRSGQEIVRFNNSFFQYVRNFIPGDLINIYADLVQQPRPDNKGGYVHIEFFDSKENAEDFDGYNFWRVNEMIEELSRDSHPLGDIAILCRSNDQASNLARFLVENGKPVVSSESLLLKNSPEISFLISLFSFIQKPHPQLELEIIRYLTATHRMEETEWHDSLRRNKKREDIDLEVFIQVLRHHGLNLDIAACLRLPVYELAEELTRIFALNHSENPFIQFFLDSILEFTSGSGTGLSEFLTWWEEKKDKLSIIAPRGSQAVQIMTIHKAKGLQFPVVIYPFADERHKMTKRYMWVDVRHPEFPELTSAVLRTSQKFNVAGFQDQYEEEWNKSYLDMVNLLYVAMTRASQRLYIITRLPAKPSIPPTSLPDIFAGYLEENKITLDDQKIFTIGQRLPGALQRLMENHSVPSPAFYCPLISNSWRDKAILSLRAQERWDMHAPDRKREWGNLIHSVMAEIHTTGDVLPVIGKMVISGLIGEDERPYLTERIQSLLSQPQISPFFKRDLELKTETEILHPSGYSYRPDRVVLSGNRATVIDYKTGQPSEDHHKQVRAYGSLLKQMGFKHVDMYLLYLEEVSLVKVN